MLVGDGCKSEQSTTEEPSFVQSLRRDGVPIAADFLVTLGSAEKLPDSERVQEDEDPQKDSEGEDPEGVQEDADPDKVKADDVIDDYRLDSVKYFHLMHSL